MLEEEFVIYRGRRLTGAHNIWRAHRTSLEFVYNHNGRSFDPFFMVSYLKIRSLEICGLLEVFLSWSGERLLGLDGPR